MPGLPTHPSRPVERAHRASNLLCIQIVYIWPVKRAALERSRLAQSARLCRLQLTLPMTAQHAASLQVLAHTRCCMPQHTDLNNIECDAHLCVRSQNLLCQPLSECRLDLN